MAACTHDAQLRPQPGAIPVTVDGKAAIIGEKGVRLVAYGSNWEGQPRDLESHFTPIEIRLENHSGRALGIRYEGFELQGRKDYVARAPSDLRGILASRDSTARPPRDPYSASRVPPPSAYQDKKSLVQQRDQNDSTYSSYNGTAPYTPPPCVTCDSPVEASALPTPDMLRMAFAEGPLEDGQIRQGFLYFEEPLLNDRQVTLKVALVDATTGETFGSLRVPFQVR